MMTTSARKSGSPALYSHPLVLLAIGLGLAISCFAQPTRGVLSQLPIEGWPIVKWGPKTGSVRHLVMSRTEYRR
jgi:hypothetical protein